MNSQTGWVVSMENSVPSAALLTPLHAGGNDSLSKAYFNPLVVIDSTGSMATMEICWPFIDGNDRFPLQQWMDA